MICFWNKSKKRRKVVFNNLKWQGYYSKLNVTTTPGQHKHSRNKAITMLITSPKERLTKCHCQSVCVMFLFNHLVKCEHSPTSYFLLVPIDSVLRVCCTDVTKFVCLPF